MRRHDEPELGPLFTVTEEVLTRPGRRREDRDVLVLRIEIEAPRREVARLMKAAGEKLRIEDPPEPDRRVVDLDKLLLSRCDL